MIINLCLVLATIISASGCDRFEQIGKRKHAGNHDDSNARKPAAMDDEDDQDTASNSNQSKHAQGGKAADFAKKLGRDHFMFGLGNDLADDHDKDGAYTLGVTLDLHYVYLVGLPGQGGWPDWNADGAFINIMTDSADRHGTVPMFTLYAMAALGDGNLAKLCDSKASRRDPSRGRG